MTLSRLLGRLPPEIPAGGRAYTKLHDGQWSVWIEADGAHRKVSPSFTRQVVAYDFLDWVTGAAPSFSYPEGGA